MLRPQKENMFLIRVFLSCNKKRKPKNGGRVCSFSLMLILKALYAMERKDLKRVI
jgi:hypothetical protein